MTREELHKLIDSEYDKLDNLPSGQSLYDLETTVEEIKRRLGKALLESRTGTTKDRRKKKDTDEKRDD